MKNDLLKQLSFYYIISIVTGLVFGFRYTVDVWVFVNEYKDSAVNPVVVAATAIGGMILGEFLSSIVSDGMGRRKGLLLVFTLLFLWSLCAVLSLSMSSVIVFLIASFFFGASLGMYHSSLDAWIFDALDTTNITCNHDKKIVIGFLLFNVGFFTAAAAVFPVIHNYSLDAPLEYTSEVRSHLIKLYLSMGIISIILATIVYKGLSFYKERRRSRENFSQNIGNIHQFIKKTDKSVTVPLVLGMIITFSIQFMDHFAVTIFLPGESVLEKTLNIALFNAIVLVSIGFMAINIKDTKIHIDVYQREKILFWLILLSGISVMCAFEGADKGAYRTALLIGLAEALLLACAPIIKAWVLSFSNCDDRATSLALLGIVKRFSAVVIMLSFSALTGDVTSDANKDAFYLFLLCVLYAAAFILGSNLLWKNFVNSSYKK